MSGFDFPKKDITARTGEVSAPVPSQAPAVELSTQKTKGPSIFLQDGHAHRGTDPL